MVFFSSFNQRYDIIICVYWFELFSQVSDVAHGPLVFIWKFICKTINNVKPRQNQSDLNKFPENSMNIDALHIEVHVTA